MIQAYTSNFTGTGTSDTPNRFPVAYVQALLILSYGATPSIAVNLEGSADGTNWFVVASGTFTSGSPQKLVKPVGEIYEFFRLNIITNTNVTVVASYIIASET